MPRQAKARIWERSERGKYPQETKGELGKVSKLAKSKTEQSGRVRTELVVNKCQKKEKKIVKNGDRLASVWADI